MNVKCPNRVVCVIALSRKGSASTCKALCSCHWTTEVTCSKLLGFSWDKWAPEKVWSYKFQLFIVKGTAALKARNTLQLEKDCIEKNAVSTQNTTETRHLSEGPTAAVSKTKTCKGLHRDTLKSLHQFCEKKKKKMQDNVCFNRTIHITL